MTDDLQTKIYKVLKTKQGDAGDFAYSAICNDAPNPGLHVKPISSIGIPISKDDAKKLYSQGTTSPFGRGDQTLVDERVRQSKQFDPKQVKFENGPWKKWLKGVLEDFSKALGIGKEQKPTLSLYKLLIYQPGGHFTPHRDSPKVKGMVATLAITLPSEFDGGEITLTHNDAKKVFDFSGKCKFDYAVAAW